MKQLSKRKIQNLTPQQKRLYKALLEGSRVDSMSCGYLLKISGSAIHRRITDLKELGLAISSKRMENSRCFRYFL